MNSELLSNDFTAATVVKMLLHGNILVKVEQEKKIKVWKEGFQELGVRANKRKAACLLYSASIMLIGNKQELIVWRALNQALIKAYCKRVKLGLRGHFPQK